MDLPICVVADSTIVVNATGEMRVRELLVSVTLMFHLVLLFKVVSWWSKCWLLSIIAREYDQFDNAEVVNTLMFPINWLIDLTDGMYS